MISKKNELIKTSEKQSLAKYRTNLFDIIETAYRILKMIIILCILILVIKEYKFLSIFFGFNDILIFGWAGVVSVALCVIEVIVFIIFEALFLPMRK